MKAISFLSTVLLLGAATHAQGNAGGRQQFAMLGDFTLESGEKIIDCKVGYRSFGALNADRSNAIIFLSWFTGTAQAMDGSVPGKMIDTTKFYLLLVDALGDGVSSSPSNSTKQPGLKFPVFTIKDMVESQYRMLTEKLNIHHLAAVAGISMGGMQTFQWAVSHPEFMDKLVPIVGSPQLTANDLLLWNGELEAMEADPAYHHGQYKGLPALPAVTIIHQLALTSPTYLANSIHRDSFNTWFSTLKASAGFDCNNQHRQLEAMISQDITRAANGTMQGAAGLLKAKMLVIVSKQDHMVNPIPATIFAGLTHATLLTLDSDCGHLAPGCEADKVKAAMQGFLSE